MGLEAEKTERIASGYPTNETWFTWGKKDYLEMWINATDLIAHAKSVKSAPHQGAGLYLASGMMRSTVYATRDGALLIAFLTNVPTIDTKLPAVMGALANGIPSIDEAKLYANKDNAEIFMKYSPGEDSYGRLTTKAGVELTMELARLGPDYLDYLTREKLKLTSDAIHALDQQAESQGIYWRKQAGKWVYVQE